MNYLIFRYRISELISLFFFLNILPVSVLPLSAFDFPDCEDSRFRPCWKSGELEPATHVTFLTDGAYIMDPSSSQKFMKFYGGSRRKGCVVVTDGAKACFRLPPVPEPGEYLLEIRFMCDSNRAHFSLATLSHGREKKIIDRLEYRTAGLYRRGKAVADIIIEHETLEIEIVANGGTLAFDSFEIKACPGRPLKPGIQLWLERIEKDRLERARSPWLPFISPLHLDDFVKSRGSAQKNGGEWRRGTGYILRTGSDFIEYSCETREVGAVLIEYTGLGKAIRDDSLFSASGPSDRFGYPSIELKRLAGSAGVPGRVKLKIMTRNGQAEKFLDPDIPFLFDSSKTYVIYVWWDGSVAGATIIEKESGKRVAVKIPYRQKTGRFFITAIRAGASLSRPAPEKAIIKFAGVY